MTLDRGVATRQRNVLQLGQPAADRDERAYQSIGTITR